MKQGLIHRILLEFSPRYMKASVGVLAVILTTADQFAQYHQFGISLYGENHASAKYSSHKRGITHKQNKKGPQEFV